jgi:hypothetical protein
MDKPAQVVLHFDKADTFWQAFVEAADKKKVIELSDSLVVVLHVKYYSLADHQFLHLKMNVSKGKELAMWVPRSMVKTIVEGKSDVDSAFSFAGSKVKTK